MAIRARLALIPLFVGLVLSAGTHLWFSTRLWHPVNIPITLSSNQVITKEFTVNVSDYYTIGLEFQRNLPFDTLNCLLGTWQKWDGDPQRCETISPIVEARWTLFSDNLFVAKGTSNTNEGGGWANLFIVKGLGGFQGESGRRYKLQVHFLKDGGRLADCDPHLKIDVMGESVLGYVFLRL